ncbi:saccharopine dehydrogenase-like oxidoreductase [Lineus longissimus]|uniref:saccharopine dehydrogenase-like oxidoreductase n=1 Tax=Lineus longissimus TaxID=88925 RepID=UPI002B4F9A3E
MSSPKKRLILYDIVILGASGFTGNFVTSELACVAQEEGITWAVAGRNKLKLRAVLKEASKRAGYPYDQEIDVLVVDVEDQKSLGHLCASARIVLNCVGPYHVLGDNVVQACLANRTHHVDISGELQFLEKVQLEHHEEAKKKCVYFIGACGSTLTSDMGVEFCKENFDGEINSIKGYTLMESGVRDSYYHSTSWDSVLHASCSRKELADIRQKLYVSPLPQPSHKQRIRMPIFYCDNMYSWCVPSLEVDAAVVYRTQRYNYKTNNTRPIQYREYIRMPSVINAIAIVVIALLVLLVGSFRFGRYLLSSFPGFCSAGSFQRKGPSKSQVSDCTFSLTLYCEGWSKKLPIQQQHTQHPDKKLMVRISGPEMVYATTAICMVQAGLTLLKEADKLPEKGGVYTPGAAFAKTDLIERLGERNVIFKVI